MKLTEAESYFFEWDISIYKHTDLARIEWLYMWIRDHLGEIDRIFWFDAFDVFFQRDPFQTLISPGKMTFISEGIWVKYSKENRQWIDDCFGKGKWRSFKRGFVLCFGTVGGTSGVFLNFLHFLVGNRTQWFSCNLDQPRLNYYFHTGAFAAAGIEAEVQHCNGTVFSLSFCGKRKKVPFEYFGHKFYDISGEGLKDIPAVVHHYKAFGDIVQIYSERCHSGLL
jgi:hypothetical protein